MLRGKIELSIIRVPLECAKHPKGSYLIEARWSAASDDWTTHRFMSVDDYYNSDILQDVVSEVICNAIKDKRMKEMPEYA